MNNENANKKVDNVEEVKTEGDLVEETKTADVKTDTAIVEEIKTEEVQLKKVSDEGINITSKDFNKPKEKKKIVLEQKTIFKLVATVILVLLIITIFVIYLINANQNRVCNNIYDLVEKASLKYIEDEEIVLDILNPKTSIKIDELLDGGYLNKETFTNDGLICSGTINVTFVDGDYLVTQNITNCGHCTTDLRYGMNWSSESLEVPNEDVVDVIVYYNYVTKTENYSSWTSYLTPSVLEKEPILDENDDRFGLISKDAKDIEIISEDIAYYSYRDLRYRYYANANNNYSGFSSTQPDGYSLKDENTGTKSEWSEWSVDYPDKESYRIIEEAVGYRFYYLEGEIKHYYNDGQYLPSRPDDKYTEYDKTDYATIYQYQDTMWKWYNGVEREYTGYLSKSNEDYPYVDNDFSKYTDWSDWELESSVNSSNESYREEEIQIRTRYRLVFDMYSFNILDESLSKEVFENEVGMTLEEVRDSEDYALIIEYKYIYREK